MEKVDFDLLPRRIFLDSSTLQSLQNYGEFIYDNVEIPEEDKIWSIPNGIENIESLRNIVFINKQGAFEFAISENSMIEVKAKKDYYYLIWACDVLDYWMTCLENSKMFSDKSQKLAIKMEGNSFGYLGKGDFNLIKDAVLLDCGAFLTMEKRLPKNSLHIYRELNLQILTPQTFWQMLLPWEGLF